MYAIAIEDKLSSVSASNTHVFECFLRFVVTALRLIQNTQRVIDGCALIEWSAVAEFVTQRNQLLFGCVIAAQVAFAQGVFVARPEQLWLLFR